MLKQSSTGKQGTIKIPDELIEIAKKNKNDPEEMRLKLKREEKKAQRKRMKVGRPGDWKCACGAMVFAAKMKCFKCGENKRDCERPMHANVSFS